MLELIRLFQKKCIRLLMRLLYALPIDRKKVLGVNTLGFNYSDNPKYVFERLRADGGLKLLFAVSREYAQSHRPPEGVRYIVYNSGAYFYHIMTCKVFITNSGGFSFAPLRKQQYVINTWHGGGTGKSMGLDSLDDTKLVRKDLALSANQTAFFVSTNRLISEAFHHALLIPMEKIQEIGQPRNDMLIHPDPERVRAVREKLGLKPGEKLALFAPTYRVNTADPFKANLTTYGLDFDRTLDCLARRFGGSWRMAVRFHPRVRDGEVALPEGVLNLTRYEDMQELLLVADVMINDFSSSMWDMLVAGKPCFLFASDMDDYIKNTGLYYPYEKLPYPKARTNDELARCILEFDADAYLADCRRYYEEIQGCETGNATEAIVSEIVRQTA